MATTEKAAESGTQPTEEEEDESSSDETEEEIEPKLKYERIANDLQAILQKDAASCIAVHPKFLCLGSHWGMIHILDHLGNNICSKELQAHTVTVNQISIDDNGDYIASCSDDGKVIIYGLYTLDNTHSLNFDRPVKSISIDPVYYKSGMGRRFITGEEKLILHEKVFLSRMKTTILYKGEGPIQNIKWRDHFVAWAMDIGVRVYDMNAHRMITLIRKDHSACLRSELYRCSLAWKDDRTLLLGWADTIKICAIKKRQDTAPTKIDLPDHYVEIMSMITTNFFICGLGVLGEYLVVLAYSKELDSSGKAQRPQMHVIQPGPDYYTEVSTDVLSIRGHQEYRCNDYHLEYLPSENLFFIVSPKDVVVAKPRDADDHIEWLMEHSKYEEAMEAVTKNSGCDLKRHTLLQVGQAYLDHLLSVKRYNDAAKLCLKILGKDKKLWEIEVYKFACINQLRALSCYLPRGETRLDRHIYEMVLYEFLKLDQQGFLNLVKEWSSNLYNVPAVINSVLEHLLHEPENNILLQVLAILYSYEKKYDKALALYLKLKHTDVFQLIRKHNLFSSVPNKIEGLMQLDIEQAINLFLENMKVVTPDVVVEILLHRNEKFLYLYLNALYKKDSKEASRKYHGLLVRLYADFDQEKLLPFLHRSDQYPIQEALDICHQRSLIPEMVFLLARMGNTQEALKLITQELSDIDQAISFCKEHDDMELWEDLISYSLDKPYFINILLHNIGTHVDPRILIQKIEKGVEIPGLRDSLVKIMHDYNLQISLQEGCKKILVSDCFNLHERLVKTQTRGLSLEVDQVCGACHRKIIVKDVRYASSVVIFFCKHAFHENCLPEVETCVICHVQKTGSSDTLSGQK